MINFSFIIYFLIIIYLLYITFIVNKLLYNYERNLLFKRFTELWSMYIYAKENAFKTLYKQQIAVFYTSRVSAMDKKESLSKLEKVFISRAIEMCGKNIINDLSKMFGGTDSIILDLSEYYANQILDLETGSFEQDSPEFVDLLNNDKKKSNKLNKI